MQEVRSQLFETADERRFSPAVSNFQPRLLHSCREQIFSKGGEIAYALPLGLRVVRPSGANPGVRVEEERGTGVPPV